MKFRQYITESRVKGVTDDVAIDWIKKNASDALAAYKKGYIIYRGIKGPRGPILYGDPKKGKPRKSANTDNYYTLWIDNSPKWKNYPKRSQSFICSTNIGGSSNYGAVYVVFPKNGSKIGIVPAFDMWDGVKKINKIFGSLDSFNYDLTALLNFPKIMAKSKLPTTTYDDDYATFRNQMALFDKKYKEILKLKDEKFRDTMEKEGESPEEIESMIKLSAGEKIAWFYKDRHYTRKAIQKFMDVYEGDFGKALDILFDPQANGFRIVRAGDKLPTGDNEIWTDGECTFIDWQFVKNKNNWLVKELGL